LRQGGVRFGRQTGNLQSETGRFDDRLDGICQTHLVCHVVHPVHGDQFASLQEHVADDHIGRVAGLTDDGADAFLGGLGDTVSVGDAVDDA
jgi:hypothetical protein